MLQKVGGGEADTEEKVRGKEENMGGRVGEREAFTGIHKEASRTLGEGERRMVQGSIAVFRTETTT